MNEMTVEAKKENLNQILDFVHQSLDEAQCSPKGQMQLDLALEELFVNISANNEKNVSQQLLHFSFVTVEAI